MKRPYKQAYNALKVLGVPVFVNEDHDAVGNFGISAEDTNSRDWVAYYDAPSDWFCGVHPTIDDVLNQYGLFAEWQNPGCLFVHEA